MKWVAPLAAAGVSVFADTTEWMQQHGGKGILHEHIRAAEGGPRIPALSDLGVRLPRGYICR
jgi:hypothetical protein